MSYYQDESVTLHHGDALTVLSSLPDASADCIITSPPYFGLRDYGVEGQLGLESTPDAFVAALVSVTRELARVVKPSGSIWVNLGDTYRERSLLGVPWRYALACIGVGEFPCDLAREMVWDVFSGNLSAEDAQDAIDSWDVGLGLQLRSEVIWAKTDGLPQSVSDRPRRTHEHWFQFTQPGEVFADLDAIREPYEGIPQRRFSPRIKGRQDEGRPMAEWNPRWDEPLAGENPLGKVPGSVWRYATSKFTPPADSKVAHFATFPLELPERLIQGWCPPGGTVLDPFSGSGTTGLAAARHGRKYIGIDLNAEYLDLSLRTRLMQPGLDFGGVA